MISGLGLGLFHRPGRARPRAETNHPFSPLSIAGLTLWLDAADSASLVSGEGAVSQWKDKSGNGFHAVQGSVPSRPQTGGRVLNGLNVVDFDGGGKCMTLPAALYAIAQSDHTILAVVATDTPGKTGSQRFLSGRVSGGSTRLHFGLIESGSELIVQCDHNGASAIMPVSPGTDPHIFGQRREGSSVYPLIDGTAGAAGAASNVTLAGLTITDAQTNTGLDGYFAEFLIYGRALENTDINRLGVYLAEKWGTGGWQDLPQA